MRPIEVVDDHTVRFRLRYPSGSFLAVLVNPRAGIIPEHLLKGVDLNTADFNRKPVGTGPFKFVEWRRGERIVMEANERYHGGRPALNRLIFRIIPDAVVLLQELRAGRRRLHREPAADRDGAAQADGRACKVLVADNTSYTYFGWRQDVAPFTDLRVRRALNHAIDVPSIVKRGAAGLRGDRHRTVPAVELGLRREREAVRLRSGPGQGAAGRGRLQARPRRRAGPATASASASRSVTTRPTRR